MNAGDKTTHDPGNGRRLLRLKPAAAMLSISPAALRRLIQSGELPVLKLSEHAPWLLDVRDLDRFIEQRKERYEL